MGHVLMTGGGKDAALALHVVRAAGVRVTHALSMLQAPAGTVRFHGVGGDWVARQARALGLEPVPVLYTGDGFEDAFAAALGQLADAGVEGVVFGNIHLMDVRAWYERRVRAAGLDHREPLWGRNPETVVREVVDAGFEARVVGVSLDIGRPEWLGRAIDHAFVDGVVAAGADPCGEFGEYHTFVEDGPGFSESVVLPRAEPVEHEGHLTLDL